MGEFQPNSKIFSVRIVSIDYYMAQPIPSLDICHSSFQGEDVNEVPVIRVYGSTPAGQKTCLHVHRALPYLYVPCSDIPLTPGPEGNAYTNIMSSSLEKALKLKGNAGLKRQHVHGCSLVRAKRLYGYHSVEELFVKIHLYHPQDISRAASLLLSGAVLDKSLQPHESHIPFILQFMVDYNLYGMGHLHLSKIKFRHPIPNVFPCAKPNANNQGTMADLVGELHLDSPVWLSATTPSDWLWHNPGDLDASPDQELHCPKRSSVCELEGDAIVDGILNQKYKHYSSLSQTNSDVKMVQSLIPIWEEEYERTGMHEAPTSPDPCKPLPEDVLKCLSLGLELGSKLLDLCNDAESPSSSSIPEIALRETDIIGSQSPPNLLSEVDGKSHIRGRVARPQMSITDNLQSSDKLGTADIKGTDKEALNLLKWLATSQSAEDIHSDDELTHEIILSPLLPSPSLDKVLEKANMDYDNESQKECQDILDSIDNLVPSQSLKKPSEPSDLSHPEEASPKQVIPQVDGSGDDIDSTPFSDSVGISSEMDITSENERSSRHYVLLDPGTGITKDRGTKLLGSLPFSANSEMDDDSEHATFTETNPTGGGTRDSDSPSYLARNEMGSNGFSLEKNTVSSACNLNEIGTLVNCSIRDLMRKKRCHRKDKECEVRQNKRVSLERENKEDNFKGTNSFKPQLRIDDQEIKQFKSCVTEIFSQDTSLPSALPFQFITDKLAVKSEANVFQDGITHVGALHTDVLISDRCTPEAIPNINLQCLKANENCEQIVIDSSSAPSCPLEKEVYGKDNRMLASCGRISSTLPDQEKAYINVLGTSDAPSMSVSHVKQDTIVQDGISSGLKSSVSFLVSEEAKYMNSIGFTMCKNTSIAELIDARSDNDPPSLACHNSHTVLNERNHDETPGKALDDFLPFFTSESPEELEIQETCTGNNHSDFHQGNVLGVPFHSQNDGSFLYPLTPKISPPPVDGVCRWLAYVDKEMFGVASSGPSHLEGSSSNLIASSMPSDFDEDVPVSNDKSHLRLDPEEFNDIKAEEKLSNNHVMKQKLKSEQIEDVKAHSDGSQDNSQISGHVGKSRSTPLSQIGFRDPASVGRGQQLTILSIEVLAESRGDLLPDPQYDAINAVALGLQNDSDVIINFVVLLRSSLEPSRWTFDGSLACKVSMFSDERHLLDQFIKLVSSSDPDILMGWDIQGGSLGFLAERALHLGLGLLDSISRTPSVNVPGNTEASEKILLLRTDGDSSVRNCVVQDDVIIEDEWGRTHASGVHVSGRVVLNVWRLMRSEVKLNLYSIEAVSETVLRRKIPFIHHKVLNSWFQSGPGQARYRCIDYVIERAKLNLEIMNQLDMINRTSELARVFGIDFFSVLSRGSQYRVESMLLRLAHTQNYLAISPGNQQVASQPAMECLPLVMEPESGFYSDPVIVLDFQSLYPSMIIAYNLCFSTCLGKLVASKPNTLGVTSFSPDPGVMQDLKTQLMFTPNGVMFVPLKVRKGVLPRLLEEILSTRIMMKRAMKKLTPSQQVLQRIYNARQLALKLIANVTYGYTAAGFSGRMPCSELADSIVQCGRSTLEKAISFVNSHERWNAKVIYGDTDSMFVLLKGRTLEESFQIGNDIAAAITAMNPSPVVLKMEKVYCPCFLLTKKRYVGYSYEGPEQTVPVFDAKGIETVRRDTCGAVAKLMERSLRIFFEHQDISKVKTYLERQWKKILSGRISLQDFVFAKEVRLGTYSSRASSLPPAAIVAIKATRRDPRAEPRYAERIAYVVIHGEPGARLVDLVVDPLELLEMDSPFRINDLYYIHKQIIPALQRVFGLVCADLNLWFLEMPRPARETIGKRPFFAPNQPRTRIDYYYLSKHCVLCGGLVQASAHICDPCSQNEIAAATTLIVRTSKLEREMQHLVEICRHCGGGDWVPESGVKCISIACAIFYERRKVQKELQALSNVAANKGLYPRCMAEWF